MYQNRNNLLEVLKLYTKDHNAIYYLREISRLASLPVKTTQDTLAKLEEQNILKSKVRGKNKYFMLNKENAQTKTFLLQAEIEKTIQFTYEYPQMNLFWKEIRINNPMIIFGSYAKGNPTKKSDIDLLIISNKEEKLPEHLLPFKLHKVYMTPKAFEKTLSAGETLIKEITQNHIILNNHSYYFDKLWNYYAK